MSTVSPVVEHPPAVLHDIDWRTYTLLLRAFEKAGRRLRLTYDRGVLEIMSPLWEHENPASLLGRFIDTLTEELDLPCRGGGSVTLRRQRKQRGLEPDKCYWIGSAPALKGKTHLDLRVDPPPDLAIEVDVTRSSVDRMGIYAALGVAEVWRLNKNGLSFHARSGNDYRPQSHSRSFPKLGSVDLLPFLSMMGENDDTYIVKQFRASVKRELLARP